MEVDEKCMQAYLVINLMRVHGNTCELVNYTEMK